MNPADPAATLLPLLQEHGRNLHSFMVLEPGLSTWTADPPDSAVAYVARGGYWVAAGGPLCSADRSPAVARAFAAAAREQGCRTTFFGVSQAFVDRLDEREFDALHIGLTPVWDPRGWPDVVRRADKLRNRIKRAGKLGVTVGCVSAADVAEGSPLRTAMAAIVDDWTASHALPPMGFMVTLELFQHAAVRRYFVATAKGGVVGFAVCVPVYGRKGWLMEDMMVDPQAPAGTSEALVDAAMGHLAAEGAGVVSLGMCALAGLEKATPNTTARHPVLSSLLRLSARWMGWLYNFEGLYRFRDKMKPTSWEPVYLVTSGPTSWLTLRAVLMAFAQGWVPRFALRVLGRLVRRRLRRSS